MSALHCTEPTHHSGRAEICMTCFEAEVREDERKRSRLTYSLGIQDAIEAVEATPAEARDAATGEQLIGWKAMRQEAIMAIQRLVS